ncbi:MAG: DUF4065 domain-containing protein [Bacteroides sp.]|nr:DUF4065 domain-containing protein [Bacteroides sp.]
MLDALKIAGYFAQKYKNKFREEIDEMKLHKLIYFFLRECYVDNACPTIDIALEARQYGPVSLEIREAYKHQMNYGYPSAEELAQFGETMDRVFNSYAGKSSWSLRSLTHGEQAWIEARKRFESGKGALIDKEDIKCDASRIRIRRYIFNLYHSVVSSRNELLQV